MREVARSAKESSVYRKASVKNLSLSHLRRQLSHKWELIYVFATFNVLN